MITYNYIFFEPAVAVRKTASAGERDPYKDAKIFENQTIGCRRNAHQNWPKLFTH